MVSRDPSNRIGQKTKKMNLGNQRPPSVRNRVATIDSQASSELSILSSDQVEKKSKRISNKNKMTDLPGNFVKSSHSGFL